MLNKIVAPQKLLKYWLMEYSSMAGFLKEKKKNKQMPIIHSEIKGHNSCLTNIYNVYIMDNGNI